MIVIFYTINFAEVLNGFSAIFVGGIAANFMLRSYTEFNNSLKKRVENNLKN